jgi:uncharacterized membrane protein
MICMLMHLFGHHDAAAQAPQGQDVPLRSAEAPRDILDRRYANGEITREHYLQLTQVLNPSRGTK